VGCLAVKLDTVGEFYFVVFQTGVWGFCGTKYRKIPKIFFLPAQDWAGPEVG